VLILSERKIRELADAGNARGVVREAFRALHRGEATLPAVISLPFRSPEGGGYGDPKRRDRSLGRKDVRNGLISTERAAEVYGQG
jgi:N-methylhydantoinase B